ncbi:MAG TPA: hypothetical protein VGA84_14675, partial [Thermoanaerobaculia bacterium]
IIADARRSEFVELFYLADEAEFEFLILVRTTNWRVPVMAKFPVDHRAARALTGWPAVVLDARLARGPRFDRVLDDARIRSGSGDRDPVLFDPWRFASWWRSLLT